MHSSFYGSFLTWIFVDQFYSKTVLTCYTLLRIVHWSLTWLELRQCWQPNDVKPGPLTVWTWTLNNIGGISERCAYCEVWKYDDPELNCSINRLNMFMFVYYNVLRVQFSLTWFGLGVVFVCVFLAVIWSNPRPIKPNFNFVNNLFNW